MNNFQLPKDFKFTLKNVENLFDSQIESLNARDLQKVYNVYKRTANNRIMSLEKAGEIGTMSPAYISLEKKMDKMKFTSPKNIDMLKNRLFEARNFIGNKTSKLKEVEKMFESIERETGVDMTDESSRDSWKILHQLEELSPNVVASVGYKQVLNEIQMFREGNKRVTNIKSIAKRLDMLYKNNYEYLQNADLETRQSFITKNAKKTLNQLNSADNMSYEELAKLFGY